MMMDFSCLSFSDDMDDLDLKLAKIAQNFVENEAQRLQTPEPIFMDYDIFNESLNLSDLIAPPPTPPTVVIPPQPLLHSTPLLGGSQAKHLRLAKRKISDMYPEFRSNYPRGVKGAKVVKGGKVKRKITKEAPQEEEKKERPRLVMKFQRLAPPNPLSPQLIADLERGKMLTSRESIHSELLLECGSATRPIVLHPDRRYHAISNTLYIGAHRIKQKIQIANKKMDKGVRDLDSEYDKLLKLQIPEMNTAKRTLQPPAPVEIKVKEDGILYLKLEEREFLVNRTCILIPRLTPEQIQAFAHK